MPTAIEYDKGLVNRLEARVELAMAYARASNPTVIRVAPASASGDGASFLVKAQTVDATATTVDTGYIVPPGHSGKLDGGYQLTDRTAHTARAGNFNAILRNYAGTYAIAGQTFGGAIGDGGLAGGVPSFSIVGGTLQVTFTPPGDYSGTIQWELDFSSLED